MNDIQFNCEEVIQFELLFVRQPYLKEMIMIIESLTLIAAMSIGPVESKHQVEIELPEDVISGESLEELLDMGSLIDDGTWC
tara:strand:- start:455 stop:700 length:246 start_codon:yes stop_codon:yes gene_type:complete